MELYPVRKLTPHDLSVSVPSSKSLINRAIILSAFSNGKTELVSGPYAEDTRVLLSALNALGIKCSQDGEVLTIHGCSRNVQNRRARVYVGSAGTAARFLTVMLAFCGGEYTLSSSTQMEKRPMDIISLLEANDVTFEFLGKPYHFPFRMYSEGISADHFTVDTDISTQYASGILLAAAVGTMPVTLTLTGSRTNGSYIGLTLDLLNRLGANCCRNGNQITVNPISDFPIRFEIEPDLSAACYFYALSLLFGIKVFVRHVRKDTAQGDFRFLELLKKKGVRLYETEDGLCADGSGIHSYTGFNVDMSDFSDQTLTVAALAAFAETPSRLSNVGHIRFQECNRIEAICKNLTALGVSASSDGENITIVPAPIKGGTVKTFDDHRVAMAFTLVGLKDGNITIENPECCKKTFENFFDIINQIT